MAAPPEPVLPLVRGEVKRLLQQSGAFRRLPPEQRRDLAHGMVRIAKYIVGGDSGDNAPTTALVATEQATRRPPTASGDMAQSGAASAQAGARALADLVEAVDFPKFVGSLIDGVFNAIVDASIKQMEAYAELVKNVAKSVDEFMKDNVTENQARDYLVDRYPDHLELDTAKGTPQVTPRATPDESAAPSFFADFGLPTPDMADDEEIDKQLVPAARRRIAMDRQQLLATMVMMGINRILVTDGTIKASVIFSLSTRDAVERAKSFSSTASFTENTRRRNKPGFFGWFSGYDATARSTRLNVRTVSSSTDESEAHVNMKAKLAGEVNVRFKSEAFPLERMTELLAPEQREAFQNRVPQAQPAQPAQPDVEAPPAPQLPALPTPRTGGGR